MPADLVPAAFAARMRELPAEGGPTGEAWVDGLPRLLDEVLETWQLTPESPGWAGRCSLVLPVTGPDLPRGAALKLGWPHHESATEHLALRHWNGRGAVQLLRADPARGVLLLERLTAEDLTDLWDEEACRVVGGLYADLHTRPFPQAPRLSEWARRQSAALADAGSHAGGPALPPRMVTHARSLIEDLTSDPDCDATLLHGDLHYENVLSDGTDWVAIDPKPMAGHPAFEVLPMLVNRTDEMGTGASFRYLLRRRAEVLCEVAGFEWDAVRDWSLVRETVNALWAAQAGGPGTRHRIGLAMTVLKALGD
ncbi:aminoglycoside phosphotransferase family protein [Kytococcus sedentarius]|uniref:aminoglycoside phosphotransferase family protein n=1 Tax=Kytococcus sedentarius TaxID=1276 RepID=UPI00384D0DB9